MNVQALDGQRAKCLAELESLAGWESSKDPEEKRLYAQTKSSYRQAEDAFHRATATFMPEELAALLGRKAA